MSGIGLYIAVSFLPGLWLIGFLLIITGLLIIRFFMWRNEYIADLFVARVLGLRYYVDQLRKFKNIKRKQYRMNRIIIFFAKLFGYPLIDSRIEYLSRITR